MNFKFAKKWNCHYCENHQNDSALAKRAITFSKELVAHCNLVAAFAAKLSTDGWGSRLSNLSGAHESSSS